MSVNVEGATKTVSTVDEQPNVSVKVERHLPEVPVEDSGADEPLPRVPENVHNVSTSKSVTFLLDIESKAIVESLGDLEDFSVSKLMSIVPKLMKHVENYKNLKGAQKRELVIKMLKHIIDVTDGPGNDAVWDPILKDLVPGLIDTLIEVNDGKLKLRKKPFKFLRLFCCVNKPKVEA